MANRIVIRYSTFDFNKIREQFPKKSVDKKKIFFQVDLRGVENNDVILGIVAYPAWRLIDKRAWIVGQPVPCLDKPSDQVVDYKEPVAFGNNELTLTEPKKKGVEKDVYKKQRKFVKQFELLSNDDKQASDTIMHCKCSISENPHLQFTVTLESGGISEGISEGISVEFTTNPSPPARPEP